MTIVSSRSSSSLAGFVVVGAVLFAAGCTDELDLPHATTSLAVQVTEPSSLGSETDRLGDDDRQVVVKITALDEKGQPDATLTTDLDVYVHFLGTLTPNQADHVPLLTVPMQAGVAEATVPLTTAFGATSVWFEDANRPGATFATGVSEQLWFRDPFLDDVSRPVSEMRLDVLQRSPLEGKQVKISGSRFGAGGKLVVTGVYAQGYTVSDVETATHTAPDYAHAFIFTFGRPRAADGRAIQVGHVVKQVSGGVSEFNGFTEFNFPTTQLEAGDPDPSLVPAPVKLDADWLNRQLGDNSMVNLERLESGLVEVDGGIVCDPTGDKSYTDFAQWKLDVGNGCDTAYSVITKGQVSDFDPAKNVGKKLTRVVGTLKAVNLSFNVWIILPRSVDDIVQ
jgi:hypothetical protein